MKTLFLSILALCISTAAFSQDKKSCCDVSATDKFSALGNDAGFREKHDTPLSYKYETALGEMITYDTPDGKTANAYFVASPEASDKWIFVFHEWWGLNDYVKKESDMLQEKLGNVNILAIDLYDGNVAETREDASKYMQGVDNDRAITIIEGAENYAGENAEIGTIGWCFGGGWSLNASLILGAKAKACVIYYGMPTEDAEKLKALNCPVLGIFAEKDGWITPEVVAAFEKNMKEAGKEVTVKMYDADHAFANPSSPKYDNTDSEDAMKNTLEFFETNLMK